MQPLCYITKYIRSLSEFSITRFFRLLQYKEMITMVLAHEVLTPYDLREFYTLTRRLLPLKLLDSVRRRNLAIDYKFLYGVLMKLNKAIQDDELLLPDLSDEELNTFYTDRKSVV